MTISSGGLAPSGASVPKRDRRVKFRGETASNRIEAELPDAALRPERRVRFVRPAPGPGILRIP